VDEFGKKFYYATRGTGGMTHEDPDDRPPEVFGGKVALYSGEGRESYLLLPIIPKNNLIEGASKYPGTKGGAI
jgi:hypothetical protein